MSKLKQFMRDQVAIVAISFISFATQPAILLAQEVNPLPFTEPLSVSRGNVTPSYPAATYLTKDDACVVALQYWGWDSCDSIDAMVFEQLEGIDTTIVEMPDSSGYVEFSDWESDEREQVIDDIEEQLRVGLAAQGEALGMDIKFGGWKVHPTLNADKHMMYYATSSVWDGDPTINIEATVFDRAGYVRFRIVPMAADVSAAEVEDMITRTLAQYEPNPSQGYEAFAPGDKVAAVGAVGVLATLAGVKYGKGAVTGIVAIALLVLKKAWFVLLLPLIWLKNLFGRNRNS